MRDLQRINRRWLLHQQRYPQRICQEMHRHYPAINILSLNNSEYFIILVNKIYQLVAVLSVQGVHNIFFQCDYHISFGIFTSSIGNWKFIVFMVMKNLRMNNTIENIL